jgi:biotin synthase
MSAMQQPSPDLCFFKPEIRHDWTQQQARALFDLPLNDLLHQAHTLHRQHFNPNEVQLSTLLNIKSGGCPEDCGYCPQSVRFDTQVEATPLMEVEAVLSSARAARANGASRFCMGAAWRSPKERDFSKVLEMVEAVKSLGLESCATLGMLNREQALRLKSAGLDYYNHNLDTSPDYYKSIISTREYEDRLSTLAHVREAGLNVCCGGIIGMGENVDDRAGLLITLANMEKHPESVPVNMLVRVEGTPLENAEPVIPLEIVRTIAVARVMMPASWLRLSAGRNDMSEELQALCFYAGANSVFFGEKLLTTDNPQQERDLDLFRRLGLSLKS